MCGRAEIRNEINNGTAVDWCVPNPTFNVFPEWDYVQGRDWLDGATVSATVEGKPECVGSGISSKQGEDINTSFEMHFPPECVVVPGYKVIVTDGVTTRSLIVQKLGITNVDESANSVAGVADIGAVVNVSAYLTGYPNIDLNVTDGTWLADFNTRGVDLVGGTEPTCGNASIQDAEGNRTTVAWCVP